MFNTKDIIVGATALAGLIALFIGFSWINNSNVNKHGYSFKVVFTNVNALLEGAPVMLRGAKIGAVEKVEPNVESVIVTVRISLNSTVIPKDSIFQISSKGIIGEKYIQIMPLAKRGEEIVKNGDSISGKDPTSMDDLVGTANAVLMDVRIALANVNEILGDPKLKEDIKSIMAELNETSKNLNGISSDIRTVTSDPATTSKIKNTLTNIDNATKKLDKIMDDIDSITGDKEVKDNLKKSIDKLGSLGGSVSGLLPTKVAGYVSVNDNITPQTQSRVRPDVGVTIYNSKKQSLNAEITDVGRTNMIQLKAGIPVSDTTNINFGIADSNLALGASVKQDAMGFSAYLLDPVMPKTQMEATYLFMPNFMVQMQYRNTFINGDSSLSSGVKYNF